MTKTVNDPYDVAEHLRTREDMVAYLEASIEEADGDAAVVAKALADIARAQGMAQGASDAGQSRKSLRNRPGADDVKAWIETAYLLRWPSNARRLMEASERAARGEGESLDVGDLRARLGLDDTDES